jgi:hypothetical protein
MLRVYGMEVDVIELFVYHVLVQELKTGSIYLVLLDDVEFIDENEQDQNEDSNITSMKGWLEWQKQAKQARNQQKPLPRKLKRPLRLVK